MQDKLKYVIFGVFAFLLVAVPYAYHLEQRSRSRNFRVVTPDILYRCGQLNKSGLDKVVHDYGFRTIITFRAHDGIDETYSTWEEEYCLDKRIAFVRIPIRNWYAVKGPPPADETVQEFIEVISDSKKYPRPVLMHCYAGVHRTGALAAIYRMEFERWTNEEAIQEMERQGYTDRHIDIQWFLENFQPSWRRTASSGRTDY